MAEAPSEDYLQDLADEVALTLLVAMQRQGIGSVRELARITGLTHTYLNARLTKTGRRTPVDVKDLAVVCRALGLDPVEVLRVSKSHADQTAALLEGGYRPVGDPVPFEMRYFGRVAQPDFILKGPDGLEIAVEVKAFRNDELAKRRRRMSDQPPTVTEEDLIGEPSVAEPERTDHEGDEDPGNP